MSPAVISIAGDICVILFSFPAFCTMCACFSLFPLNTVCNASCYLYYFLN